MAPEEAGAEGKPPFFKSWRGAYIFVLAALVLTMVVFTLVTRAYA